VKVLRKKQKRTQYSEEFKRQAVERMKTTDNIVEFAKELGISRQLLYQWEAAAEGRGRGQAADRGKQAPVNEEAGQRELDLRKEVEWLRAAVIRKTQEADFFKGALQKVKERRQSNAGTGAMESSTKFEK
jgi:transposase-like protein